MLKKLLFILLTGLFFLTGEQQVEAQSAPYTLSAGLRLGWGWGLDGKYFLKDNGAVEALVMFRTGTTKITGLYEVQKDLDEVTENLDWYFGGGASLLFVKNYSTHFGISGVIGTEYTFTDVPITISLDWIPTIYFTDDGFDAEGGLLTVRYIITE